MHSSILALAAALCLVATPALASPDASTASTAATKSKGKAKTTTTTKKKTTTTKKTTTKKAPAKRSSPKRSTKRASKKAKPVVETLLAKGVIGLQVGGSASYFECDCVAQPARLDYESTYGLAAGVTYDKMVNRFLSYRVAGRYHAKGAAFEGGGQDIEITLTTVELEATGVLRYALNPFTSLFLHGGGFVGGILGAEATADGDKVTAYDDDFALLDYGLSIGGGAFFALSRSRGLMASATLTYQHGFANIADSEQVQYADESDALVTRAVQLGVGLHF